MMRRMLLAEEMTACRRAIGDAVMPGLMRIDGH